MKIADFGLAIKTDPAIPEKLRCGSPGYVAPEVLNNLGYGTKADIFSAGIILFVMLTGTSPFYTSKHDEILMKNKEGTIVFNEQTWKAITSEAKDLVTKMLAKNPEERISAKEALKHPWLQLDFAKNNILTSVQENIKKYNNTNRFNMKKIKPEFSMLTCTPLLNGRGNEDHQSPLLADFQRFIAPSPCIESSRLVSREETKEDNKGGVVIRNLQKKSSSPKKKQNQADNDLEDGKEDFNIDAIEEKQATTEENIDSKDLPRIITCNFKVRVLPATPGFSATNSLSYLKSDASCSGHQYSLCRTSRKAPHKPSSFKKLEESVSLFSTNSCSGKLLIPKKEIFLEPNKLLNKNDTRDEEKSKEEFVTCPDSDNVLVLTKIPEQIPENTTEKASKARVSLKSAL